MFPPGDGPSPRVIPASLPTQVPAPSPSPAAPSSSGSGNSAADDMADIRAAHRAEMIAEMLRQQIEREQAELKREQEAAEAAKRHAQEVARQAWEAQQAVKNAKNDADRQRAQAESDHKGAELDAAAADWQLKEKQAAFTKADLADAKEWQKDPGSTKTRPTQAAVVKAQGELDDAAQVKDLLDSRVTAMDKEAAAEKAEATARPKNFIGPVSPQQVAQMDEPAHRRAEANDAQAAFNQKLMAWDVKQKLKTLNDAKADLQKTGAPYVPYAPGSPQAQAAAKVDAAQADYDDAVARQKAVNLAADAAHKQLLALQADDKVKGAQKDLLTEQQQLKQCVVDSPATRALKAAQSQAQQAHFDADTATTKAQQGMLDYQIGAVNKQIDAAKADLQDATHGQYGPYVPGTKAGDASARLTQLQSQLKQLQDARQGTLTTAATTKSQQLFATLTPDQQQDPKALWNLFSQGDNATTIAQPMLNQYYQQYGDAARSMSGTYLDNMIGITLGLKPQGVDLSQVKDAAQRDKILHDQALFTSSDDKDKISKVRDHLRDAAGEVHGDKNSPNVALLPIAWGAKDVGMTTGMLYRVDGPGGERFVDDQGKVYHDWSDYRHHNGLPPTDSKIVLPKDGHLTLGADGNVVSENGKASLETGWQTFTRHADPWVAGITVVGGLLTDAAGVFLLPFGVGEAMEVGGTAMIVGGVGYFTAESTVNLVGMVQHDQSLDPIHNAEARNNELMLASSVLTLGSMGAAMKAGSLAAAGRAGDEAAAASARSWTIGSKAVGYSAMAAGTAPMVEQSVYAAQHWDTMTDQQKSAYWHQMSVGAAQMFINPVLRGGMIGAGRATGRANPNATILPAWMTGGRRPGANMGAPSATARPDVEPTAETTELAPDALTEATTASGRLALDAGAERGGDPSIVVAGSDGRPITLPVVDRPGAPRPGSDPTVPAPATTARSPHAASPTGLPGPAHVPGLHTGTTGSDALTVTLDLQRNAAGTHTHGAGGTRGGAGRGDGSRPGDSTHDGSDNDTAAAGDPAVRDPRREARERARDPRAQALSPLRENAPRVVVDAQGRITLHDAKGRPVGGVRPADLRYTSAKTGEGVEVAPPDASTGTPPHGSEPLHESHASTGDGTAPQVGEWTWTKDTLAEAALHPAVRAEVRKFIDEAFPESSAEERDSLFNQLLGDRDTVFKNIQDYETSGSLVDLQKRAVLGWHVQHALDRLTAKGVRVDLRHWSPVTEPRPELYRIRPTTTPDIRTPKDLAEVLDRVTPQSTRIAKGIKLWEDEAADGVPENERRGIRVHLLDEQEFNTTYRQKKGEGARLPLAFAEGRELYLNKARGDSWALVVDAVHEGTHALDNASYLELGRPYEVHGPEGEVLESGVHEPNSFVQRGDKEARAYYHQLEFAQAMGLNAKNKNVPKEVRKLLKKPLLPKGTLGATHTMGDVNRHIELAYPDALKLGLRRPPRPGDAPMIDYQRSTEPPSGPEGTSSGDSGATPPATSPTSRPRITVRGRDGRPLGGRVDPANLRYTSAKTDAEAQLATTEAAASTSATTAALTTATTGRVPPAVRATNLSFDDGGSAHRADNGPPLVGGKRKQVRALPARAETYDQVRKGQAPGTLMRPAPEQTELLNYMRSDKAWRDGDSVRFIVSPHAPDEVFVNDGGTGLSQADHPLSYGKFEEAQQAAAADGGAWVYRVSGPGRLIEASFKDAVLDPKRIEGAMRVYDDGELFPAAAPNLHHEVPYVNPKLATARSGVLNAKKGRFWQEGFVDAGLKAWRVKNKMAARFGRDSALPERLPPEQRPAVSEWARAIVGKSRRATREGDVHFHRLPYDRRLKLAIASMLKPDMSGDLSRIAFGAIPQGCGKGYYSAKDSWELTFKQAWKLDRRFARDFNSLKPEEKARADVMITGKNPAEPGFKAYVDDLMRAYPGVFKGIGELTVHKEYVSAALGKERAKLSDESLKEVFEAADQHGLVLLVHNDWGHAPVGKDHLHTQGHDEYHYFDKLVDLASKYPNVRLVLAHTGWARYFKGNTEPGRITMHGEERVMPEHVARMYTALERAPNVHFDISWNDVGEAYVFNPQMGDALVNFVMEHPDRVLYGSDSVKPPNGAFYHHNKTVLEPLLDRIDERSPLAAWLLERGNYERLFNGADVDSVNVATARLRAQGQHADADALQAQVDKVRGIQRDNRETLIRQDPRLVAQLRQMRATDPGNPLLRMFDGIDVDSPLPHEVAAARANATAAHGDAGSQAVSTKGLPSYEHLNQRPHSDDVNSQYEATDQAIVDSGKLVTTSSGDRRNEDKGAIVVAGAGLLATTGSAAAAEVHSLSPAAANNADMSAFLLRSAAGLGRNLYGEWLRFAGESLFEEGHITPEKIDWYQGRIEQMARKTGLDEDRIQYIKQATEQFRVDIDHIQNAPLRPGESHADRFEAVSAAAGLWSIRIDGALGTQGSSLEATNPRTKLGQFIRLIMVTTFAHNAAKNGLYFTEPHELFTPQLQEILKAAQHGMYMVADAALAVHSAMGFASGVNGFTPKGEHYAGSNWESRVKGIRRLQTYAMPLFSAASGALTLVDAMQGHIPETVTDALFTAGTAWSSRNEIRADRRNGYPKPWMAAAPTTLTMLAIAARVLFGYGDVKNPTPASSSAQGPATHQPPWLAPGVSTSMLDAQAARAAHLAHLPDLPDAPHPRAPHEAVIADSSQRGSASLWRIADAHVSTLLTPQEERAAQARGGHEAVVQAALSQLIQLNPQQADHPGVLLDGSRVDVDRFDV